MPFGEKIFPANQTNLDSLPDSPGVFTLYKDGTLIFIGYADGSSQTIKSQIMGHKEGYEVPLTKRFDHYTREVRLNVVVRYRELMQNYARKYHRWPKGNEECCRVLDDDTVATGRLGRHRRPQRNDDTPQPQARPALPVGADPVVGDKSVLFGHSMRSFESP